MQPTQDALIALIEGKVPPGYERLAPGTILEEGDLLWNFIRHVFQPQISFADPNEKGQKGQRRVSESNYAIRKVNQEVHPEETVSQDQAPKPNYGLW